MEWYTVVINIGAVVGAIATMGGAFYAFYANLSKKHKAKRALRLKREETLNSLDSRLDVLNNKIDDLALTQENMQEDIDDLKDGQDELHTRFDQLETTQLKHIIVDTFYSYGNIAEIPDEQLYNAAECCDIYLGKGLNHGTGAKCRLIAQEIERRQRMKAEGK